MTDQWLRGPAPWRSVAAAALFAALAAALPSGPAAAQTSQMQELMNRIERLQQELTTLQSFVYRGQRLPAGATAAAPPPGAADVGGPMAARLSVRITQLENEIGRLTGQNEEFGHAVRQMQARLDKLVTDVDSRLAALERRSGVAGPGGEGTDAPPPAAGAQGVPPPAPSASAESDSELAPGPRTLGQLRVDPNTRQPVPLGPEAAPPPAARAQPQQQAARPPETPEQMYDRAQTMLLKEQNVDGAERVLRSFLDTHPKHPLAANAHYWLGRTYFVRQDYQQAAFTFADAFQKYPKSDKAPDNLLNLGMSLARLGKTNEACTAYQRLLQNFPKAEDRVKRLAASERQRAKCR